MFGNANSSQHLLAFIGDFGTCFGSVATELIHKVEMLLKQWTKNKTILIVTQNPTWHPSMLAYTKSSKSCWNPCERFQLSHKPPNIAHQLNQILTYFIKIVPWKILALQALYSASLALHKFWSFALSKLVISLSFKNKLLTSFQQRVVFLKRWATIGQNWCITVVFFLSWRTTRLFSIT